MSKFARKIATSTTMLYQVTDEVPLMRCAQLDHNPKALMKPLHVRIEFLSGAFHEIIVAGRITQGHGLVEGSTGQVYRIEASDERYLLKHAPLWVRELVSEAKFAMIVEPEFGTVE